MPAIAYGGRAPQVPPDKLAESLVFVEFVGDRYPDSGITPKDPVKRAQARLFMRASPLSSTPVLLDLQRVPRRLLRRDPLPAVAPTLGDRLRRWRVFHCGHRYHALLSPRPGRAQKGHWRVPRWGGREGLGEIEL